MTVEDDDHFWTEGNTGQSAHQICSIVTDYDSFPFSKILTSGLQTQGIKKPGKKGPRAEQRSGFKLHASAVFLCHNEQVTMSLIILGSAAMLKSLLWHTY